MFKAMIHALFINIFSDMLLGNAAYELTKLELMLMMTDAKWYSHYPSDSIE